MLIHRVLKVPINYDMFWSDAAKARGPSAIRSFLPLTKLPGMISLGGGSPNPKTFPITSISFTFSGASASSTAATTESSGGGAQQSVVTLDKKELEQVLQYSQSNGFPELAGWFKDWHMFIMSQEADEGGKAKEESVGSSSSSSTLSSLENYDVMVTTGSQDGLTKALEAFLNPGDPILIESPTYSGTLSALRSLRPRFLRIPTDEAGLDPDALEKVLQDESSAISGGGKASGARRMPKLLYTIPNGSNPTGQSCSLERKKRIYALAQAYNLLILEDDPYFLLQFQGNKAVPSLIPTYLSMDVDGRVVRFDSLSKVLSAGLRIGFVTAPKTIIARLSYHQQSSVLHCSGPSQAIALALLKNWGHQGLLNHAHKVLIPFYEKRSNFFYRLFLKHLKPLGVELLPPQAGMFAWLKLNNPALVSGIKERAIEAKVLLVPGFEFIPRGEDEPVAPCDYVRASFSIASEEEMEIAVERLTKLLQK